MGKNIVVVIIIIIIIGFISHTGNISPGYLKNRFSVHQAGI